VNRLAQTSVPQAPPVRSLLSALLGMFYGLPAEAAGLQTPFVTYILLTFASGKSLFPIIYRMCRAPRQVWRGRETTPSKTPINAVITIALTA
jgi:hypothetical protein